MHKTFLISFSDKRDDRPTYIYPPLDKRYSPIISSICGPNNINLKITSIYSYKYEYFLGNIYSPASIQYNNLLGQFQFSIEFQRSKDTNGSNLTHIRI